MQRGEVSRSVLRRTVQKEIHGQYKAYGRPLVSRLRPVQTAEDVCQLFEEVLAAMLAKRALVQTVSAALTLSSDTEEAQLRELMRHIDSALAVYGWKLADLQVRTDCEVRGAGLLAVSAVGEPLPAEGRQPVAGRQVADRLNPAEAEVLLVGYPGAAGAKRIYQSLCELGRGEFHGSRVIAARLYEADTTAAGRAVAKLVQDACRLRTKIEVWPLGEGGLFTALYDLAHGYTGSHGGGQGRGLVVELPEVPVTAATVALCEKEELDPYRLWSSGSYLLVTEDAAAVIAWIEERVADWPWPVTVIGRLTNEGELCLQRVRSQSNIEKPVMDELYRREEEEGKR